MNPTNAGKVETILCLAHPNVIAALQNGSLKIDSGWSWCKLRKLEQLDEFARREERRTQRKILQEFSPGYARAPQLGDRMELEKGHLRTLKGKVSCLHPNDKGRLVAETYLDTRHE